MIIKTVRTVMYYADKVLEAIVPMILSPPKVSVEHLEEAIRIARRDDSDTP